MVSTRPQKEYRRSNAGLMSPMAKPNKASQKSAPYSASAKKAMANKMLNGASVAASKAKKPVYWALSKKEAAKLWGVAKAGAALWWVGKLASKWAAKLWSAAKTAARWIKNVASKASKSIYPSMPWVASVAGRAAARWASKIASKIRK